MWNCELRRRVLLLTEIIANGENKTIEFKVMVPSNESIAKTVIAFANTGGGRLIIGVDNNRVIKGLNQEDIFDTMDKIASVIHDNCHPNIIPESILQILMAKLF